MKFLKRFTAVLTAIALVAFVTGCDDDDDPVNTEEVEVTETPDTDESAEVTDEPEVNEEPEVVDEPEEEEEEPAELTETTIWFADGFDWIEPWAEFSGCGDAVGNNDVGSDDTRLAKSILSDGTTGLSEATSRGYGFIHIDLDGVSSLDDPCVNIQKNYLKFGKSDCQAGIFLPVITGIHSSYPLVMTFDWCPVESTSLTPDDVSLAVDFIVGTDVVTLDVPGHDWVKGQAYEWIPVELDLSANGVTITKDTRVCIRSKQWGVEGKYRWYFDNISIYSPVD